MKRIKAFYPIKTEKIVHIGNKGNEYYLDAIDIPLRICKKLINDPRVDVFSISNSDNTILYNTHTSSLINSYKTGVPQELAESSGLKWNSEFNTYVINTAYCAVESFREAIKSGKSIAITSGGHHAEYEMGRGFGPVNNMIIAARELISTGELNKVAILDLDVHYANGTHSLVKEDNILSTDLWKYKLPKWKYTPNDKQIFHLGVINRNDYFVKLGKVLERIVQFRPDLVVVFNGLDVLDTDRMGGIHGFGEAELELRSNIVGDFIKKYKLPVTIFTGGGYIDYSQAKGDIEKSKVRLTDLYIKSIFSIMNCEKKTTAQNKNFKTFI